MAGGASSVSTPGRPVLKGHHLASVKRNLVVAVILSFTGMFAYKYFVTDPKKRDYAEFYKNYDPEAAFQRMRKAGIFNSAPADD